MNDDYLTITDYLINKKLVFPVSDHWACRHCDKTSSSQKGIVLHFSSFKHHYGDEDPHNRDYHTWAHDNPNIPRRETEYFKVYPGDPASEYGCIWCGKRMPMVMTGRHFIEKSPKNVRCRFLRYYHEKRERLAAETAEIESAQQRKDELVAQEEPEPDVAPEPEYEDVYFLKVYLMMNRETGKIIERVFETDCKLYVDCYKEHRWVLVGYTFDDVHASYDTTIFMGFEQWKERRLVE